MWITNKTGPHYAETYYMRHREHHAYTDTKKDPHSPYQMPLVDLFKPWKVSEKEISRSPVKTPTDWIEINVYQPYRQYGRFIMYTVPGILFGPLGFFLAWVVDELTEPRLGILIGNWAFHKIGFNYEKNATKSAKAKILFPIGILFGGEELHTHHHNNPNLINYRKYWFELDIGYVYAVVFKFFGWLDFVAPDKRK